MHDERPKDAGGDEARFEVVAGMLAAPPSHVHAGRVIELLRARRIEDARRLIAEEAERTDEARRRALRAG